MTTVMCNDTMLTSSYRHTLTVKNDEQDFPLCPIEGRVRHGDVRNHHDDSMMTAALLTGAPQRTNFLRHVLRRSH